MKGHLAQKLRANIPYKLTHAQERAIAQILGDIQRDKAMNRIVQGDVGSGKTFVALFAATEVIENGSHVAFMAPTDCRSLEMLSDSTCAVVVALAAFGAAAGAGVASRLMMDCPIVPSHGLS